MSASTIIPTMITMIVFIFTIALFFIKLQDEVLVEEYMNSINATEWREIIKLSLEELDVELVLYL